MKDKMTFAETEKIELKHKFNDALPKEIVAFLSICAILKKCC